MVHDNYMQHAGLREKDSYQWLGVFPQAGIQHQRQTKQDVSQGTLHTLHSVKTIGQATESAWLFVPFRITTTKSAPSIIEK